MVQPNYLGTASGLTGIPTLLLSSLQNVEDTAVKTALYQIQNWANSFYTWNFDTVAENYTTGGLSLTFANPFASTLLSYAIGVYGASNASQAQVVNATLVGLKVVLYNPSGTQIPNGDPVSFSYIAVGH